MFELSPESGNFQIIFASDRIPTEIRSAPSGSVSGQLFSRVACLSFRLAYSQRMHSRVRRRRRDRRPRSERILRRWRGTDVLIRDRNVHCFAAGEIGCLPLVMLVLLLGIHSTYLPDVRQHRFIIQKYKKERRSPHYGKDVCLGLGAVYAHLLQETSEVEVRGGTNP